MIYREGSITWIGVSRRGYFFCSLIPPQRPIGNALAYGQLRTCWDKCFEQPIKEIWEHEKDMQVSALIVRSFPMEYVEGNKELLTIGRNYYYYCLRRSDDRSFVADESLLKEEEYIHFLNVGRSALPDYYESIMPSDEKILDLLFRMARRVLIGDINPG